MKFGLKHDRHANNTTAGTFDVSGLFHLGVLSGEQELKWTNMTLTAGVYHMYTDGINMFLFPAE